MFDKQLLKKFGSIISWISIILSLVVIFADIPSIMKPCLGYVFIACIIIGYFGIWIWANNLVYRKIYINNSIVEVKAGDIFKEPGLKAIAFNEYFDTLVDEKIISSTTLNGKFIKQKITDIKSLDELIANDTHLQESIISQYNTRKNGKINKYKLGTILLYCEEYLITAFSRFDDQNRAILTMPEYLEFLVNFWNEVDRVYSGRSIVIPLLGSGITRFRGYDMVNDQELLEILIWSFKISRIKFTYPAQVTIIIYPDKKDRISFFDLKGGDCSV